MSPIPLLKVRIISFSEMFPRSFKKEKTGGISQLPFLTLTWQALGGELDLERQQVSTTTTTLGLYALMSDSASQNNAVYLPIIIKQN